jgi:origin recognition complex subunit 1
LEPEKEEIPSEAEVEEEDDGAGSDVEIQEEEEEKEVATPRKRKSTITTTPKKRRTATTVSTPKVRATPVKKGRKLPHPKSSTSNLPATIIPEDLPTDPYQRALRLLHVGATPDSLPCREEEFVDVLSRVEEGVEGGGGGCLCESTRVS